MKLQKNTKNTQATAEEQAESLSIYQQLRQAARMVYSAGYRRKRNLTVKHLLEIAGLEFPAHLHHIADREIANITTDIYRVEPDDVYVFWDTPTARRRVKEPLVKAAEQKPLLILTDEPCDYPNSIQIPNSSGNHEEVQELYIRMLHYIRSIHRAKVIGITGSIGKTSTKEMMEAVLRQQFDRLVISEGNNNSIRAVGRNIQDLKQRTAVYLQEVGATAPGVVEFSARQLDCDMVIYTNISTPHRDQYGSVENTLKDKASLSDLGKSDGLAIVNYDEPMLMSYPFRQKKITYSLRNPEAMYFARDIQPTGDGYIFQIVSRREDGAESAVSAEVHALGEHNVLNAVAAWAAGKALKIKDKVILEGIQSYRASGMRQNLLEAAGYRIFADCYNANQIAIEGALCALDQVMLPDGGKRIAVLGDVLSLGDISEEIHREIGLTIKDHKVDKLICFGNHMKFTCEEALEDGVDAVFYDYHNRADMEAEIRRILRPEDVILLKASHLVNLGATLDRLFGTDSNESISIGHRQYVLTSDDQYEYYAFADSASVKTCLSEESSVVVPSHIKAKVRDEYLQFQNEPHRVIRNLAVEKIGKTAFRDKTHIRHVLLPGTLIRIRDRGFKGSGIEELRIPEGTLSLGKQAFADCPNLKQLFIPDSVKDIGPELLLDSPQAVIVCSRSSAAAAYALETGCAVEYTD